MHGGAGYCRGFSKNLMSAVTRNPAPSFRPGECFRPGAARKPFARSHLPFRSGKCKPGTAAGLADDEISAACAGVRAECARVMPAAPLPGFQVGAVRAASRSGQARSRLRPTFARAGPCKRPGVSRWMSLLSKLTSVPSLSCFRWRPLQVPVLDVLQAGRSG